MPTVSNNRVCLERVKGIEPSSQAWEARILPMNYTRMVIIDREYYTIFYKKKQDNNKFCLFFMAFVIFRTPYGCVFICWDFRIARKMRKMPFLP